MDVIWLRPMNGVRSTRPLATEGADAGLGAVLSRLQMDLKAALLPPQSTQSVRVKVLREGKPLTPFSRT